MYCEKHSLLFKTVDDLNEHKAECESLLQPNICLYNIYGGISCKAIFKETGSLVIHYLLAHGKYACSKCYGHFDSFDELERHQHYQNLDLRLSK